MRVDHHDGVWTYDSTRRWPRAQGLPHHHSSVRVGDRIAADDVTDFEHYLSGRWGLYSRWPTPNRGITVYAPVDHPRWDLYRAELLDLDDALVVAAGLPEPTGEPIVHWTPGVEVRVGRPRRVRC